MSSRNTRSIDKLLYAVHELQQGHMLSYVEIHTGDEFETLSRTIQYYVNRLNDLIEEK